MMAIANDEINHVQGNSVKPGLNADVDPVPLTKCRHQKIHLVITSLVNWKQFKNCTVGKEISDGHPKAAHFPGNRRPFLRSRKFRILRLNNTI